MLNYTERQILGDITTPYEQNVLLSEAIRGVVRVVKGETGTADFSEDYTQRFCEWIGVGMAQKIIVPKMLILIGKRHSGKEVFFEAIKSLIPEKYISTLSLRGLLNPQHRARLDGKRINISFEKAITLRTLTSKIIEDIIHGRPLDVIKDQKPIQIKPSVTLFVACEKLPKNMDPDTRAKIDIMSTLGDFSGKTPSSLNNNN